MRQEDALVAVGPQVDPAVLERPQSFQASVASRWRLGGVDPAPGQQAALDQHLEAVADAQHQLAGGDELVQRLGQAVEHLVGEDLAGGHVVAVAEPAGIIRNWYSARAAGSPSGGRRDALGLEAGQLQGELRFAVAVGARRPVPVPSVSP